MIGVTVGVGSYLPLARQAAMSMAHHTGLECVVLSDEHYQRAGLQGQPPHLLKLALWDFVDEEEVLVFDADTLCLQPWNPAEVSDERAVVAVRDWIWREGIQAEAEKVDLPLEEYFLSSVMLFNRRTHEPMLRLARSLYQDIDSQVFEQTALNAARYRLQIPIKFLDRRYNWSLFGAGNIHEQSNCIVAHFNYPVMRSDTDLIAQFVPGTQGSVDTSAWSTLGNRFYRYVRMGYDERPLYLRSDGTIGLGGGNAERFWYVRQTADGRVLVIGSETTKTCELVPALNGDWQGRWFDHERMPILLTPHHGQVLLDLLGSSTRNWRGAEIGVFRGHTSTLLLSALPNLTLWMVDSWRSPQPGDRNWTDPHLMLIDSEQMLAALGSTMSSTEFARQRRRIVVADMVAAAASVRDQSLDFVFLDADHSYAGTLEALHAWMPKVISGGIVAGNDLDYPDYPGVRQAVEQFCAERQLTWQSGADFVWWFVVPLRSPLQRDALLASQSYFPRLRNGSTHPSKIAPHIEATSSELGNRYHRYVRVGHDERPLFLRSDGVIGFGSGDAERIWNVRQSDDGAELSISSETALTCKLHATSNGEWQGKWLNYERMPIQLTAHRGQVLLDLLGDPTRCWRGAEIGVFEGHTSALLLDALPHLNLWMVDAWSSPAAGERLWDDPYMRHVSSSQMLTALNSSITRTQFARDRRTIIVADFILAAECIPDHFLDFVFLDADHSRAGTLEAIEIWLPKVVPGGIVAGHDLDHPDFPGVRQAVEDFCLERQLTWLAGADFVWWFEVPVPSTAAPPRQRRQFETLGRSAFDVTD